MRNELRPVFSKGMGNIDFQEWMLVASKDPKVFKEFWEIAQKDEEPYAWRALWIIEHAIQKNKSLLDNIYSDLLLLIIRTENNSFLRIGLKIINLKPVEESDTSGRLLMKCEKILLNPKIPIATRANALQFFFEFCKTVPELIPELKVLMEHLEEQEGSSGMKARFRIIRKTLKMY